MTTRGFGASMIALAVVALGSAEAPLLWVGIALFATVMALIVIDYLRAPGPHSLRVQRLVDDTISVGAPTQVRIIARAAGRVHRARIRDEAPSRFEVDQTTFDGSLPADTTYTVVSRARGDARFGDIVARVDGPLGLAWRQTTISAATTIHVNADLSAISHYQALARRGQLAEIGVRTLRRIGEGSEFERIREAVPDDPLRSINWRATARTGRFMAIDVIPERAQPVVIAIDHGRLMGVGAGHLARLDHAINASVLLAHVCIRSGDRLGLLAFADRVTSTLPPHSGNLQLQRYVELIRGLEPQDAEADYAQAFLRFSQLQKRRALVVIFTDVADPDQVTSLAQQCLRLRRRHVPLVITIKDPAVVDMSRISPENGADMYSRALARSMQNERGAAVQMLRAAGADVIDADARNLSPAAVNRYLELKRAGRI